MNGSGNCIYRVSLVQVFDSSNFIPSNWNLPLQMSPSLFILEIPSERCFSLWISKKNKKKQNRNTRSRVVLVFSDSKYSQQRRWVYIFKPLGPRPRGGCRLHLFVSQVRPPRVRWQTGRWLALFLFCFCWQGALFLKWHLTESRVVGVRYIGVREKENKIF